ncbi:RING finger protein B-like [Branchiostoma floridae]|uniref:RING finger protein B-like n=1 Tax=Branchiostoma floridae TaxID=7739 RepID=A0A9J7HLJ0_BRAFL|nr:RING finger protein B-like [Branchiostoma floridae]
MYHLQARVIELEARVIELEVRVIYQLQARVIELEVRVIYQLQARVIELEARVIELEVRVIYQLQARVIELEVRVIYQLQARVIELEVRVIYQLQARVIELEVTVMYQLQARVIELERQVKEVAERNKTELNKLTTKLSLAEKEVMNKEISYHDAYNKFKDQFQAEVKKLKALFEAEFDKKDRHVRRLEEEAVTYSQTLHDREARLDKLERENENFPHTLVSEHHLLVEEVQHYRGELQKRCALITQYVERQQSDLRDKNAKQKCQTITNMCTEMMEEMHNQRYVCSVCHTKRRSHLIQPCGHYNSCETCLLQLTGCPLCKEPIQQKIKVYE